jgi:hypothetical protein
MTTPTNNPVFCPERTHQSRCQHTARKPQRARAAFAVVTAVLSCGPTRMRGLEVNGVGNGTEASDQ